MNQDRSRPPSARFTLAEGVLSEDAGALARFDEADLRALLAPLPGV